ncbi:hypothetical protein CR205_14055 [Alteribacter lacisalsi]|uniref:DUF2281 domain-containing protein n=1 Tax=Alteribacter lacisalsi TaxID=2045244 RepID=A0A2W0H9Q5_9BACI|nr:hypothetical protein [Alteribacter lacisalsi]PYZ96800.1 hypothetical protein CR205_14055 [Alteribacter lacisalsi]
MAVNREELHRMVDHLSQDQLDEAHDYILQLKQTQEEELSQGQVEGLFDQDAYYEEGEKNPPGMASNRYIDK